jgi:hypothetical protein
MNASETTLAHPQLVDWLNSYFVPVTNLIAAVFEFFSFVVFLRIIKDYRNIIYLCLLVYSISDLFILLISILNGLFRCENCCQKDSSFYEINKFFKIYMKIFMNNSLYSFNVLIEIMIALSRYFIMSNQKPPKVAITVASTQSSKVGFTWLFSVRFLFSYLLILFLFVLSICLNIPYLSIYKLIDSDSLLRKNHSNNALIEHQLSCVQLELNLESKYKYFRPFVIAYFTKDFILLICVCIFNFLIMIAFKEKKASWSNTSLNMRNRLNGANGTDKSTAIIQQEGQLFEVETTPHLSELVQLSQLTKIKTNQKNKLLESKERSVSLMITSLCLIFLLAHLPETFLKLIRKLNISSLKYMVVYLELLSNFVLSAASFFNFFVYYFFSRLFRQEFMNILSSGKRKLNSDN